MKGWQEVAWYMVAIVGLALFLRYYKAGENILNGTGNASVNVIGALQGFPV